MAERAALSLHEDRDAAKAWATEALALATDRVTTAIALRVLAAISPAGMASFCSTRKWCVNQAATAITASATRKSPVPPSVSQPSVTNTETPPMATIPPR